MSQFAAGCAICGADLERHRAELAARRRALPRVAIPAPRWGGDVHPPRLALALLFLLVSPFLALLFGAWFAYHADQDGREGIRNALIGVCGAAVVMAYVAPFSIWALLL